MLPQVRRRLVSETIHWALLTVRPDSKLGEEGQLEVTVPQDVHFRDRAQQAPVTVDTGNFSSAVLLNRAASSESERSGETGLIAVSITSAATVMLSSE